MAQQLRKARAQAGEGGELARRFERLGVGPEWRAKLRRAYERVGLRGERLQAALLATAHRAHEALLGDEGLPPREALKVSEAQRAVVLRHVEWIVAAYRKREHSGAKLRALKEKLAAAVERGELTKEEAQRKLDAWRNEGR